MALNETSTPKVPASAPEVRSATTTAPAAAGIPPRASTDLGGRKGIAPLTLLVVVGALMTVSALATDAMLPAFPAMAAHFAVSDAAIQSVVSVFMLGYALPHLVVGSFADRFGRRPVLLLGLGVYLLGGLIAWVAPSLPLLLAGRFVQGLGASTGPILSRAVLRDLYQGRELGRMLSFAMIFFGAAPLLAPTVGAVLLGLGSWRAIFVFLVLVAVVLALLVWLVLPETAPRKDRDALNLAGVWRNARAIFTDPVSAWIVLVMALVYAGLMSYLLSAPALYIGYFGLDEGGFALVFAIVASMTFLAQPLNVRLLRTNSSARILRFSVPFFVVVSAALVAQVALGIASLPSFTINLMAFFVSFSLTLANGTTVALDPHRERAGMASGLMGFAQLALGTALGSVVAAFADRGPMPFALGLLVLSLLSYPALRLAFRDGAPTRATH